VRLTVEEGNRCRLVPGPLMAHSLVVDVKRQYLFGFGLILGRIPTSSEVGEGLQKT
jgi:hypothetical protein